MSRLIAGIGLLVVVCCAPLPGQDPQGAAETVALRGRIVAAAGDVPVAGALVRLAGPIRRDQPREALLETRSADDGSFSFAEVPRRRARVIVVTAPGRALTMHTLAPQGSWDNVVIRLEPGRDLRGRVVDASSGTGIAKAVVSVENIRVETGADGGFVMEGLEAAATATLLVRAREYRPAERAVEPGEDEVAIALAPGAAVRVEVVDDVERPLEGVRIRVRLPKADPYSGLERAEFVATTGADGSAVVSGLPGGEPVFAEAQHDGYVPAQSEVALARTAGGPQKTVCRVVLSENRFASVAVQDPYGRPIARAVVRLMPVVEHVLDMAGNAAGSTERGASRSGETQSDGVARFDMLPAGRVACAVFAPDHLPQVVVLHPQPRSLEPECAVRLERDPEPPGWDVPWCRSIATAWKMAARDRLPVWISMGMDGERANDAMAARHFHDPEIVRLAREMPSLLSNVFGKGGVPSPAGVEHDERDGTCTRYGSIPCASHQVVEPYCISEFVANPRTFSVPLQILVAPDGEVLAYRTYHLSERDLANLLVRALRHVNPGVATRLARQRGATMLRRLAAGSAEVRAQAAADVVALANAGDEMSVALLGALEAAGVGGGERLAILEGLHVTALHFPASALAPFVADNDDQIRKLAARMMPPVAADDSDAAIAESRRLWEGDIEQAWESVCYSIIQEAGREPAATVRLVRALRSMDPAALKSDVPMVKVACNKSCEALIREEAAAFLGRLRDENSRNVLRERLTDDDLFVRARAALSLLARGDPSGSAVLLEAMAHPLLAEEVCAAVKASAAASAPATPEACRDWLDERTGEGR